MDANIAFSAVEALDAFLPDDLEGDDVFDVLTDPRGGGGAAAAAAAAHAVVHPPDHYVDEVVPNLPGPFSAQPKRSSEGDLELRERKRSRDSSGFEMRGGENKVGGVRARVQWRRNRLSQRRRVHVRV